MDRGNGITCDENCTVYVDGFYSETILFDTKTITSTGKKDMFILKINDACFAYDPPVVPVESTPIIDDFSPTNIFSPNGDGLNDQLLFFKTYKAVVTLLILNRWGNVVYESNDLSKSWDGKDQKNMAVTDGVYFYSIEYTSTDGEIKKYNGFVSLVK